MYRNMSPGAIGIRADFRTTLALAAGDGWQGIDLPVSEALALAAETSVDHVAALVAGYGLRLGGWGLPLNWRVAYDAAALEELGRQAALAGALGCTRTYTWLLPFSDERPFRENFEFHVQQLRPVAEVLAEHGCRLGLEFIGPRTLREGKRYGFIYSPEAMLWLSQAIGPNVGLLYDCWHWYTAAGTASDIRGLRADDIVYVHVNDGPAGVALEQQQDLVRGLPGSTGVVDIKGFLQALAEIGYDGPVTPEPFVARLSEQTPQESSAEVAAAMRKIFQDAGLE